MKLLPFYFTPGSDTETQYDFFHTEVDSPHFALPSIGHQLNVQHVQDSGGFTRQRGSALMHLAV